MKTLSIVSLSFAVLGTAAQDSSPFSIFNQTGRLPDGCVDGYAHFGVILPCFVTNHEPQDMVLEQTPALTHEIRFFDRDCVPWLSNADSEMCVVTLPAQTLPSTRSHIPIQKFSRLSDLIRT